MYAKGTMVYPALLSSMLDSVGVLVIRRRTSQISDSAVSTTLGAKTTHVRVSVRCGMCARVCACACVCRCVCVCGQGYTHHSQSVCNGL